MNLESVKKGDLLVAGHGMTARLYVVDNVSARYVTAHAEGSPYNQDFVKSSGKVRGQDGNRFMSTYASVASPADIEGIRRREALYHLGRELDAIKAEAGSKLETLEAIRDLTAQVRGEFEKAVLNGAKEAR